MLPNLKLIPLVSLLLLPASIEAASTADIAWKGLQSAFTNQSWEKCQHQISAFRKYHPDDKRQIEATYLLGISQIRQAKNSEVLRTWSPFFTIDSDKDPKKSPWIPKVLSASLTLTSTESVKYSIQREQWLDRLIKLYSTSPATPIALSDEIERRLAAGEGSAASRLLVEASDVLSPETREKFFNRLAILEISKTGDLKAMREHAQSWTRSGRLQDAALLYQEMLKQGRLTDETVRVSALDFGRMLRASGAPTEAMKVWERVVMAAQKDAHEDQARYELAFTRATALKQPDQAQKEFTSLLEARPYSPLKNEILVQLARLALAKKNAAEARSLLSRIAGEPPNSLLLSTQKQLGSEAEKLLAQQRAATVPNPATSATNLITQVQKLAAQSCHISNQSNHPSPKIGRCGEIF